MRHISFDFTKALGSISHEAFMNYENQVADAMRKLYKGTGRGHDFLGWVNLPSSITDEHLNDIIDTAVKLRKSCQVVVVVGIGGSYLGARAVIDASTSSFDHLNHSRSNPVVLYAGQNIGEDYLYELLDYLDGKNFGIINISKSGTTTEPAIAFRLLKQKLENLVGKEQAREQIVAVTDAEKGALRKLADQEGYKTFIIPDSVGGRFSVLTPVGLLPIAVAGCNIRKLVAGAKEMEGQSSLEVPFSQNMSALYAVARNELYKKGKKIEILVNFHPKLHYFNEWWKQLYGESEGKEHKGLFPTAVDFSTDLHSMGQWIQEGERSIFETVLSVEKQKHEVIIPHDKENLDGLNFLAGMRVDDVNKMAELGTQIAHVDGGVPNLRLNIPELNEFYLGEMIYFFEKACGISGYLLEINPFDQPGVEAYKKNMFALLDKPGFEEESKAIKSRI